MANEEDRDEVLKQFGLLITDGSVRGNRPYIDEEITTENTSDAVMARLFRMGIDASTDIRLLKSESLPDDYFVTNACPSETVSVCVLRDTDIVISREPKSVGIRDEDAFDHTKTFDASITQRQVGYEVRCHVGNLQTNPRDNISLHFNRNGQLIEAHITDKALRDQIFSDQIGNADSIDARDSFLKVGPTEVNKLEEYIGYEQNTLGKVDFPSTIRQFASSREPQLHINLQTKNPVCAPNLVLKPK